MVKRESTDPPAGEPPAQRPRPSPEEPERDSSTYFTRYAPYQGPVNIPETAVDPHYAMPGFYENLRMIPTRSELASRLPPVPGPDARWRRISGQDIAVMATQRADEMLTSARLMTPAPSSRYVERAEGSPGPEK